MIIFIIKKGYFELLDFRLEIINLSFREVIFIAKQIKDFNLKKKILLFNTFIFKFKFFKLKISTISCELFVINNHFYIF